MVEGFLVNTNKITKQTKVVPTQCFIVSLTLGPEK